MYQALTLTFDITCQKAEMSFPELKKADLLLAIIIIKFSKQSISVSEH